MVSENNFITPKQDTENCKTGDYKEPDYIETNNFTPNVRIDELFCVTGKDLDCIDIDIIFDDNEMVL